MNLFQSQEHSSHDSVFGTVLRDRHGWKAEVPSPSGVGTIEVRGGGAQGDLPNEQSRHAFRDVVSSYRSAIPKLQAALFSLWGPELQSGKWDESAPSTAEALWAMLELEAITVEPNGTSRLHYGFSGEFWPDASLAVELARGVARPLHLDD
jgi:hypothetical protein